MSFVKTAAIITASAVMLSAPAAFAQSAGTSYTGTTAGVPGGPNGGGSNSPAATGSMGRSSGTNGAQPGVVTGHPTATGGPSGGSTTTGR